jgi:penicillin-binding protein 2
MLDGDWSSDVCSSDLGAKVPGIAICGKTGTVENYYRGVKQPNHSFFCAFAPRENPKIAIMCVVENSGRFGGTYAAPIVSLMIEKYINDTIDAKRKSLAERMENINLIPPLMLKKMREKDSIQKARVDMPDVRNVKDTLQSEDNPTEAELKSDKSRNSKPARDTQNRKNSQADMVLPNKQQIPKPDKTDTIGN